MNLKKIIERVVYQNPRRTYWIEILGAFAFFFLATALLTYPFIFHLGDRLRDAGDALLQTWVLSWAAHQLVIDPLTVYEAPIFYPYPHTLAFTDSTLPQSVLTLPIALFSNNPVLAHNLDVLLALVLSGFNMYLLVRAWHGNFASGLAGGLIYAFASYHFSHFGQMDLLSTQWLPLVLLFLSRAMDAPAPRTWFLFGFFFCLQASSSFYYAFFTAGVVGIYWIVTWTARSKRFGWRLWIPFGITLAAAFLVLVILAFPYFDLSRAYGLQRMRFELGLYKATPLDYFVSFVKNPLSEYIRNQLSPANGENTLAPGWFAILLGTYYAVRSIRRPRTLLLLLIAGLGLVMSLGPETKIGGLTIPLPSGLLYDFAPGIGGAIRVTARWGVLVLFAFALLAAFGFDKLSKQLSGRSPVAARVATGIVLLALVFEYNPAPLTLSEANFNNADAAPVYHWLAAQPPATMVELPMGLPSDPNAPDIWYQFRTLFDHQRIMNGASGFAPPFQAEVANTLAHFPSAESVGMLQQLGVRYVLVHSKELPDWARASGQMELFGDSVHPVQGFGDDFVYEIEPAPLAAPLGLELALPLRVDPSVRTSGYIIASGNHLQPIRSSVQGSVQTDIQWFDAGGNVVSSTSSQHAIPLTVDSVPVVIRFDLQSPASPGDYTVRVTTHRFQQDATLEKTVSVRTETPSEGLPKIQLIRAILPQRATRSGDSLNVTLFWNIPTPSHSDYAVFIHVQDASGKTRAQFDGALQEISPGLTPSSGMFVGQYHVPLAKGLPQGRYTLAIGLFTPANGEPIPILSPDDQITDGVTLDETALIGAGWNQAAPRIQQPLHARFDNGADLEGLALPKTTFAPGETIPLTLYWHTRARTAIDYTVFVHLRDATGKTVAQADAPPLAGDYPTSAWNVGEWIRDLHSIALPSDLAPGTYTFEVGWYRADTGERSAASAANGNLTDTITLGNVEIGR